VWTRKRTAAVACAALLFISCSSGGEEEPAITLSEVDRDRSDLCFDAKTLPPGFELTTRNPAYFDGTLADDQYKDLGRTASRAHRYAFTPPSAPAEDADGFLTPEERAAAYEQAALEAATVPFIAATCRVDIYATVIGAKDAIEAERDALTAAPALPGKVTTELTSIEESYTAILYQPSPSDTEVAVTFRTSNLIGRITLTGTCNSSEGQGCTHVPPMAESLARLLFMRVDERLGLQTEAPSEPTDLLRASAEDHCPEQDYLGCINEYVLSASGPEQVGLCRTQYGGWFFEPPAGEAGDRCSDGDARIVTILGGG